MESLRFSYRTRICRRVRKYADVKEWITMIFDTHSHYDDKAFDEDREELISSFGDKGIGSVVTVGADIATSKEALALAGRLFCHRTDLLPQTGLFQALLHTSLAGLSPGLSRNILTNGGRKQVHLLENRGKKAVVVLPVKFL